MEDTYDVWPSRKAITRRSRTPYTSILSSSPPLRPGTIARGQEAGASAGGDAGGMASGTGGGTHLRRSRESGDHARQRVAP